MILSRELAKTSLHLQRVALITIQSSTGELVCVCVCALSSFSVHASASTPHPDLAPSLPPQHPHASRNIPTFMIQGGDPTNTGKGGSSIWGTKFSDEFHPSLRHDARGIVSMANKGPDTNQSQFFIIYGKMPHLNNNNTIVGKIIFGLEVLDLMEKVPCDAKDRPLSDVLLKSITIHANPFAK